MQTTCFQDESKYEGSADSLFLPETIEELTTFVKNCKEKNEKITVQGALTGITGSGVPTEGCALGMQKLQALIIEDKEGAYQVCAQAGVTAEQLERAVRKETNDTMFFPALPTEKTATLGGIAACGARGIYTWHYGEFQEYVTEISVCDVHGDIKVYTKDMPEFAELFRSEGMLAILCSFRLTLIKKPPNIWGIMFQFLSDESACHFADTIEEKVGLLAMEYMDRHTVLLIQAHKRNMAAIATLPDAEQGMQAMVYVEIGQDTEDEVAETAEVLLEACMEAGGDPDMAWAMCTEEEIDRLRAFRHAASECVNMEIGMANGADKRLKKQSVDIRPVVLKRQDALLRYQEDLRNAEIRYCIFGHFGNGCPYVNLLAKDYKQYQEGAKLIDTWVQQAYAEQAEVFREHGIGKLKKEIFCRNAPVELVSHAIRKKEKWDKGALLNPGNMF